MQRDDRSQDAMLLKAVIQGISEGLIISDGLGNVTMINKSAAEMMGLDEEAGLRYAKEFMLKELKLSADNGLAAERYVELTSPAKRVLRVNLLPVYDGDNKLAYIATLLTDVSKDKEAERIKSDFVSTASHELRTPLTSIREAVAIIKDGIVGPVTEKQDRCLDVALEEVDRLARIVNDLLNLSRIESRKVEISRKPCIVSELIAQVTESFSSQAAKLGIETLTDIPEGLPQIFADRDQIVQVLTNLVGNALKFTSSGGRITVSAKKFHSPEFIVHANDKEYRLRSQNPEFANFVEIAVKDTGPGISDADKARLFQRFSQLESGLTRKVIGSGLGLAITKGIVAMHGGSIRVDSELGKGSAFIFTVPVFSEDSAYLDLLQKEIGRAKKAMSNLSLIFIDPCVKEPLTAESVKLLALLELKLREALRRPEDSVLTYRRRFFIVITEANLSGAERFVERAEDSSRAKFSYKIAVFPQDGVTAEDLWSLAVG